MIGNMADCTASSGLILNTVIQKSLLRRFHPHFVAYVYGLTISGPGGFTKESLQRNKVRCQIDIGKNDITRYFPGSRHGCLTWPINHVSSRFWETMSSFPISWTWCSQQYISGVTKIFKHEIQGRHKCYTTLARQLVVPNLTEKPEDLQRDNWSGLKTSRRIRRIQSTNKDRIWLRKYFRTITNYRETWIQRRAIQCDIKIAPPVWYGLTMGYHRRRRASVMIGEVFWHLDSPSKLLIDYG